ncbi:energy transducer TonB [Hymenobacter sp. BT507]|uniref:Energy transducer TonB n=1 Tax=Hymenobacter citatus TaxID=2763506 RepID=A0ABR7MIM5_9BACT|nr:energy transducer TonB [Hymenobacter citatus]MBC6610928.1 energy transducer TonB [Hymenobacter citatus]
MLFLPILNVHLHACPADWHQMAPTSQGRHCAHCNREVIDFTNSTAADLEAARAAAPGGRLCGRFRQDQLAAVPQPQLRPKLRRFLVALVLVCGLGLSGREAWAQVQAGASKAVSLSKTTKQSTLSDDLKPLPEPPKPLELPVNATQEKTAEDQIVIGKPYSYVGESPEFPGGVTAALEFIRQNVHYPAKATKPGIVFITFSVTRTGQIEDVRVIKGVEPALDAEALRVVRSMPCWIPARRDNQPIRAGATVPVKFELPASSLPISK